MNNYCIRRILVPLDLSESSINALDTAVVLAKKYDATLFLLSVNESISSMTESESSSMDVLTALAGAVRHADDIEPVVLQEEGNVTDCIVKTVLEKHCDLVVIGTHGASGFRDGFIGSNAYGVIKFSPCPVLSVPSKRKYSSFKKVLFPVRPVAGALIRYDTVSKFVSANGRLDVMGLSYRAMEEDTGLLDKIIDEIREQLDGNRVQAKAVWGKGIALADAVLGYAQQIVPDLVVVTSVLDVVSKSNYIGPHAQKIIHQSKYPVLIIKKVGVPAFA